MAPFELVDTACGYERYAGGYGIELTQNNFAVLIRF
jgi:hypothetical protein